MSEDRPHARMTSLVGVLYKIASADGGLRSLMKAIELHAGALPGADRDLARLLRVRRVLRGMLARYDGPITRRAKLFEPWAEAARRGGRHGAA